jgi:hypothetical protein
MALQEIDWGLPLAYANSAEDETQASALKAEALHHWLREPALQELAPWLGSGLSEGETLAASTYTGTNPAEQFKTKPLPLHSIKPLQQLLEATKASATQPLKPEAPTANPLDLLFQDSPQPKGNEALNEEQWQSVKQALHLAQQADIGEKITESKAEPYVAPYKATLEQVAQKEPYLDRFTQLIAMRLSDFLNEKAFRQDALQVETLRQDNLVLARYVQWLLTQHHQQKQQLEVLQQELNTFKPAWGGFYRKH